MDTDNASLLVAVCNELFQKGGGRAQARKVESPYDIINHASTMPILRKQLFERNCLLMQRRKQPNVRRYTWVCVNKLNTDPINVALRAVQ